MTQYLTKENILSLIQSAGLECKRMAEPSYYAHEDRGRATRYQQALPLYRQAWKSIQAGANPTSTIQRLMDSVNGGIESNRLRLILSALGGMFERKTKDIASPTNKEDRYFWLTYEGDLFWVSRGNKLNLPQVIRTANEALPAEDRKTDIAQKIADMLPNPTTRIHAPIQVR